MAENKTLGLEEKMEENRKDLYEGDSPNAKVLEV